MNKKEKQETKDSQKKGRCLKVSLKKVLILQKMNFTS